MISSIIPFCLLATVYFPRRFRPFGSRYVAIPRCTWKDEHTAKRAFTFRANKLTRVQWQLSYRLRRSLCHSSHPSKSIHPPISIVSCIVPLNRSEFASYVEVVEATGNKLATSVHPHGIGGCRVLYFDSILDKCMKLVLLRKLCLVVPHKYDL